jgi:hypothetical protein
MLSTRPPGLAPWPFPTPYDRFLGTSTTSDALSSVVDAVRFAGQSRAYASISQADNSDSTSDINHEPPAPRTEDPRPRISTKLSFSSLFDYSPASHAPKAFESLSSSDEAPLPRKKGTPYSAAAGVQPFRPRPTQSITTTDSSSSPLSAHLAPTTKKPFQLRRFSISKILEITATFCLEQICCDKI